MNKSKPWEDFEGYRLQLQRRRLEQEQRMTEDWHSLRRSWQENGDWVRKQVETLSSGQPENLIWGPVGRFLFDLVRSKLFHSHRR